LTSDAPAQQTLLLSLARMTSNAGHIIMRELAGLCSGRANTFVAIFPVGKPKRRRKLAKPNQGRFG